jgi:phosphate starvation-inducible PhoH-like protein
MRVTKWIMIMPFLNRIAGFYIHTTFSRSIHLYSKKNKQLITPVYLPKTVSQKKYVDYLDNNNSKIIISLGPAGTGKTMFACQKAITHLRSEEINKIIITRPVVTVEEEIGFLPGNIVKKMDPWTKPIFDIFLEYFNKAELDLMLYNNKIEICPLAFMRGRTFKNAFIIADEMQNSSPNQMKMLVTRLGDNSRMVITGDLQQTDIKSQNGLEDFISRYNTYQTKNDNLNNKMNSNNLHNRNELIRIVNFSNEDVERSEIVKKVIEIYDYKKENNLTMNPYNTKKTNNILKLLKYQDYYRMYNI